MMSDLTTKQRAAIAALLEGQTKTAAATAAGVGRQTVSRWLNEPAFTAALREGSDAAVKLAAVKLAALAVDAIEAIEGVMNSPATPGAAVKLRAADSLLGHVLRIREQADILERIAALEEKLEKQTNDREKPTDQT
jgi:phage terminase small subunit